MAAEAWGKVAHFLQHADDILQSKHSLIPEQGWEIQAQQILGLSLDQVRFTVALFLTLPIGLGMRLIPSPFLRRWYALLVGVAVTYYPFGQSIIQSVIPTLLCYLAMVAAPGACGTITWATSFPYLIYMHVRNASGLNWGKGIMDFTGCEMVLVLKLISIAMARQDYVRSKRKKQELSDWQRVHALPSTPNLLDFLTYAFALGNLLSGPYFEYSEWAEFIDLKGVWSTSLHRSAGTGRILLKNTFETGVAMFGYLFGMKVYNAETFTSPGFFTEPFAKRMWIQLIGGLTNQLKYVFAWKLSETSLTLAGFNFLGWDDTNGKPVWGRCCNVRWFTMLACDSARLVPQYWNIGTGTFLRRYVYERLTPKGRKAGFIQLMATQLTSAIWHGLYPGYLMFFASTAIWLHFSTVVYKAEQSVLGHTLAHSWPWYILKVLWTHYSLNYMAAAFMILELAGSWASWKSVYFWPHILMLVGNTAGVTVLAGLKRSKRKGGSKEVKKEL